MAEEVLEQPAEVAIPEDYAAFTKFRDASEASKQTPAADEEETPPSESVKAEKADAGQTAEESEPKEETQQEEKEDDDEPQEPEKGTRLSRRMRKLTGTIAELQSRLDGLEKEPETEAEVAEEVASSTETVEDEPAEKLVRPMLKDYEDTETQSAWDQYEVAMEAYNDAKTERQVERRLASALAKQASDLELKHAKATADAAWNQAASRFPDYNEVVREEVKISVAMEAVMRMDPENGTALAYYMGQHPEESERIARATLANNEQQWGTALARAGVELGKIQAKLTPPGKPGPKAAPVAIAKPATKTVSTASKPPTQIRGGVAAPAVDVLNADDASNYAKWVKAREAQLKRK
jgi:hypothetical protein